MVLISKEERIKKLTEYVVNHQEKLYRLTYSYVHHEQTSLDIIQDAIVKALDKIMTLKQEEYMTTWFYRILINECLKKVKKKEVQEFSIEEYELADKKEIEEIETYEIIQKLKPKLRTVIILRFFEQMKIEEIAKITNTNINTVKSRLYKALNELKLEMKEKE